MTPPVLVSAPLGVMVPVGESRVSARDWPVSVSVRLISQALRTGMLSSW